MDDVVEKRSRKNPPALALDNGIEDGLGPGGPEACALAAHLDKSLCIKSDGKVRNGLVNGKCNSDRISKKAISSKGESFSERALVEVNLKKEVSQSQSGDVDSAGVEDGILTKVSLNASENCDSRKNNEDCKTLVIGESRTLDTIEYVQYESELQMPMIMKIIQKDLSEPYSIYTYRYFIHNWPKLCFLAMCKEKCVGAIVCKLDIHRKTTRRGYIAMLAVDKEYRKRSIGSTLVRRAIEEMITGDADEVVLETEVTNEPALKLYGALGFVRDKRLFRYYLNGVDALRLKLWLR